MSQTIITLEFEQYKAQQEALALPIELDEFVLANIPNQDATLTIDRGEGLPDASHIVLTHQVTQTGYVNSNAVVYSLTMGTDIGDFDFNWIGLRNKSSGVIAAICHLPGISKTKTIIGSKDGNSITRSIMMSYSNAQNITGINIAAATWQIDFTARLFGIDERERLTNVDHYGTASFLDDGFKVVNVAGEYKATKGVGYVGGLRCFIENDITISNVAMPSSIYLDTSWQGLLTSKWETVSTLSSSTIELKNYVDSTGVQHYITKIAEVYADGDVVDTRFLSGATSFERSDNSATNDDIDNESTVLKHVKLPQLWRGISNQLKKLSSTTIFTAPQFQPWDKNRAYKTGEVCTIEVDGEVVQMQMYAGPNMACTNKNPADLTNRQDGWIDETAPFWWIPYKAARPGTALWPWMSTAVPEGTLNVLGNSVPAVVFWRAALAVPELVNAETGMIDFPETRGEFFRVLDQGRGVDAGRGFSTWEEDEFKSHNHKYGYAVYVEGTYNQERTMGGGKGNYTTSSTGGSETRPRNLAFPILIEV